jgi:uncharacterized Zn finger protein
MGIGENYWYYEPTKPREVKDGIKAKSQHGVIGKTWWSRRWIDVLESLGMGARLARGRSYARRGQVVSMDIRKGVVHAKVQGTRPSPYNVEIRLRLLSDGNWDKVADAMASQAIFVAKLLSGEMPQDIEDAFSKAKVSLFPSSEGELDTNCSCPDWANPCKHIAAVYYLLAERFDEDPFLIFKLRGRTKEEIIQILRGKRGKTLPREKSLIPSEPDFFPEDIGAPLEDCLDTFWEAGKALDSFVINPTLPEVDNAILKRLGKAPFSVGKYNIATLLAKAYDVASSAALQRALGSSQEG